MLVVPLLVLTLFVFALVDIILRRSDQVKHLPKVAWVFIVILLPLIGSILWFAVGREYETSVSRPRTLRMPATRSDPWSATGRSRASDLDPASTEAQLAALEREIEDAERAERIRRLEDELRRRSDTGETA